MSTSRVYALIDCNNFFVSCERVFRPDLWEKPVAVLSNNDGCIVARSNEVKALGIPMGAPYFQWKDQLTAANVTLFSGNFPLYGDISQRIVTLIRRAAPTVEVYSVDESFVELSDLRVASYEEWALSLRNQIWQYLGVPVSIGLAPTKTLAKAAAEYAKKHPDNPGVYSILGDDDGRIDLLKWLPIGDVWGFGWRSSAKLRELGVATAYDITTLPDTWVQKHFTIRGLRTKLELQGVPALTVEAEHEPQASIARTRSFAHRVRNYHELEAAIANFAAVAASKLRASGEVAGGVVTFIRTGKHTEQQRSVSAYTPFSEATEQTGEIIEAALRNLQQIYDPDFGYKRAGVVLTGLATTGAWQASLFARQQDNGRNHALMAAVDEINSKYGVRLIKHATEGLGKDWRSKREMRSPNYTGNWHELPKVKA